MISMLALIALVTLTAPFGDATASAVSLDDGMTVEITVEVDRPMEVVIARPFSSFEELPPTALSDLGDGSWGGFVVLPSQENWSLLFDAFETDGTTFRSDTTDLLAMGVDKVLILGEPAAPVGGRALTSTTWWLIAAVVLVLGSLGALTWWTFLGDDGAGEPEGAPDDDESTESQPHG